MATQGSILAYPEAGWVRHEDSSNFFNYLGTWNINYNSAYSSGSRHAVPKTSNGSVSFIFKGTGIRVIGSFHSTYSSSIKITIDGDSYYFSQAFSDANKVISFEKKDLKNKEHLVTMQKSLNGTYSVDFILDAVDTFEPELEYKHLLYKDGKYGYVEKKENQDLVPKMNSNQDNGIKIESSPVWTGYEPYLAFDKENSEGSNATPNAWATEGTAGGKGWISVEFSKSNIIKGYTLMSRSPVNHINEMPKRWTLEALDENGLWIVLDTRENEVFVENIKKEYSFNNNKVFSKYRLNVVENGGPFQYSYICIGEIELLGEEENFVSLGTSLPTDEQFEQYGVEDLTEWLPFINEIQGEKKIITKASKPLQSLNVDYLPETQFIKQNDFIKINKETLGTLSINEGQTKGNIRVAAQFPDVDTFSYVFKDNTWSKIAVTDATVFSENGNTIDEMNLADWSTSPLNQQVRFIYTMKMNDIKDSVILSSIDIKLKGVVSSTPVIKKAISLIKAYTFNGYLENIERLNTINFEKLEFKSDSLINAQQNQMHNLVIDVFNSDSMESVSSTNTNYQDLAALTGKPLGESFLYEFSIDDKEIVGVK